MKTYMKTAVAAIAAALSVGAMAEDVTVDAIEIAKGAMTANGNDFTASSLEYYAPDGNDSQNCNEAGWYVGIRRTWALSYTGSNILNRKYTGTKASDTKASFSDNAGRSLDEYGVFLVVDLSPDGSGIKNAFQLGGITTFMKTTDWNVWVTPETMHALAKEGKDYVATLTIGGETYTMTVPQTLVLTDGEGVQWYPAIAVVDGKVYGDMGKAVEAATLAAMDGKEMEFYEEPTDYPEGVLVEKDGDVWKLVVGEAISLASATIELSATEVVVRDADIPVEIDSVMFGEATLELDKDYTIDDSSVLQAKEIGEYTVTVNGKGNYTGSVSATWKIVSPTGEFAADAMSIKEGDPAYGSVAAETPTRFDITDTSKLVYKNDDLGERWEAAVQIRWPREEAVYEIPVLNLHAATSVSYTDAVHAMITYVDGEVVYGNEILVRTSGGITAKTNSGSYYVMNGILPSKKTYTYFDTLTWVVPFYVKDIEAAIKSGSKHLTYSIKCGSVAWGDETEGNVYGLKETEFSVDLRLSNVFLLDDEGNQVYPKHNHDWRYALSNDGTTLTAKCEAEGCILSQTEGEVSMSITSKDATNPAYAEGHFCDGKPAEATLSGADDFAITGVTIGDIKYAVEGGAELGAAPVEPGRYSASVVVTADGRQGESGSWTLRVGGLEILAGEAVVNGEHAQDAAAFLEKATSETMEIAAGRSYEATKTYVIPEKYKVLIEIVQFTCGPKTYDLAGFTVTAPVDAPLFENNGNLTIRDTSEGATGAIAANPASESDVVIVNAGTLTIEGGTFYGSIVSEGGSVTISGGKFSVKPDAAFVADGYDLVKRGNLWSVEPHQHNYKFLTIASHVVIATCVDVLAEDSLQISHCSARVMVGVVGMQRASSSLDIIGRIKEWLGYEDGDGISGTLGKIPEFIIDYDRKEHEADFFALNLTAMAEFLRNDALLELGGNLAKTALTVEEGQSLLEIIGGFLKDNISSLGDITSFSDMFMDEDAFAKQTGVTFGEFSYLRDREEFEGKPIEAGWYTATLPFETPDGKSHQIKGEFIINEKELPIETEGHSLHIWDFEADGAKVVATCPGNILTGTKCNASPMAIELVPSVEGGRKVYDAEELSVVVSNANTFAINTEATVSDIVYLTKDGEELDGPPVEPGEYVAKVDVRKTTLVILSEELTPTIDLVIEERPVTGEFPNGAFKALPSQSGYRWGLVTKDGDSAVVVNSRRLDYDAEAGVWSAPLAIEWPADVCALLKAPRYTDVEHAVVSTAAGDDFTIETAKSLSLWKLRMIEYVSGVAWTPKFTLDDVFAALDAGKTELTFEISVGAKCWADDFEGLRTTVYRLVVPLQRLVLPNGGDAYIDVAKAYDLYVNTHTVSGLPTENAVVTVNGKAAVVSADGTLDVYKGKTVAVTPADGYLFASFIVDDEDVEAGDDGAYSFVMADSDIEVECSVVRDIGYAEFVSVVAENAIYTGEPLTPVVTVIDSEPEEVELLEGTDYTLAFFDANDAEIEEIVDVGEYTVVVTGIGAYGGTATATFAVTDYAGAFAAYKLAKIGVAEAMAEEGDSAVCAGLIATAIEEIAALNYDDTKTLEEQYAVVDAIITKLASDLATQRSADADAAQRAADEADFNAYKTTQSAVVAAMAEEGDSAASTALITAALEDIADMEYDATKPLADQKAAIDAIVEQLTADLATQRAADAEAAQRAADEADFNAYKTTQSAVVAAMAEEGDSAASTALITAALEDIAEMEYDATKPLADQKAAIDAIVTQLATDLATQRAADADAAQRAADEADFNDYKTTQSAVVAAMAEEGDSAASTALITAALEDIADMEFDATKPLADQKAAIDAIVTQLATDLATQRAADAEAAQRAEFDAYKTAALLTVAGMAEEGDSDASTTLITDALAAIDALEYDDTTPLDDQKDAIDDIVANVAAALIAQRASDAADAQRASDAAEFADYKTAALVTVAAMAEEGDSEASTTLINDAFDAIDAMEFDDSKPLADQKAAIDDIVANLAAALVAQRAADAEAAQRAADEADFNDYKTTQSGVVAGMAAEGDSEASTALINDALAAVDAVQFDDTTPLADQKAAIDAIVEQLTADLANQRAADAEAVQRAADEAEFNDYKATQSGVVAGMAADGDSAASTALINDALAAIDAVQFDDTKPLADQKAAIDAIVEQLTADLANQRAADADGHGSEESGTNEENFNKYRTRKSAAVGALALDDDSDASKALIAAAKAAIEALQYDSTKSLDEQKAAIDAIMAQLEADLAAQRAADATPSDAKIHELVLHQAVTGTVDLSRTSKWLAYLRDAEGNVVASAVIHVGRLNSRTGLARVRVVVSLSGITRKTRINGTMDSSGVLTVGSDTLTFGANAVKGAILGRDVDGSRDLFTSRNRAEKAAAKENIEPFMGNWTVVWGDVENGWYAASVKLAKSGKVTMRGWSPFGKGITVYGKYVFGDEVDCVTFVSTKKTAPFALNMWFMDERSVLEINEPGAVASRVGAGGVVSTLSSQSSTKGLALNAIRTKLVSDYPKASISIDSKTGRITGVYRSGTKNVTVRGYLVNGIGYGFGRIGRMVEALRLTFSNP